MNRRKKTKKLNTIATATRKTIKSLLLIIGMLSLSHFHVSLAEQAHIEL
jgi:hypothetical protein